MVLTYWKALASNDQVGNLRNRAIYITSVYTGDKAALMAAMPRIAQVDICNQWAAEWVQLNEYQTPMSEPPEFPDDLPAFPIVWVPDPRLDKASYTSELQSRYYNAWHSGNFSRLGSGGPGGHSFLLGGHHERSDESVDLCHDCVPRR
jgi:hypothetical protein